MGFTPAQTAKDRQPLVPVEAEIIDPKLIDSKYASVAEFEAHLEALAREAAAAAPHAPAVPKVVDITSAPRGERRREEQETRKSEEQALKGFSASLQTTKDSVAPFHVAPRDYNNHDVVRAAMHRKLAASGISVEVIKQPGKVIAMPLTAKDTYALTGWANVPSFRIFYYDLDGNVIKDYVRLRFLALVRNRKGDERRYWSPKDSAPRLYLPPVVNWREIVGDRTRQITATEGELKALALSVAGVPTLALQGVWSFGSARRGIGLLSEFKIMTTPDRPWERTFERPWEVVFDSDLYVKPGVRAALYAFMTTLLNAGAISISYVLLPGPEKGVDDYLVVHGADGAGKYKKLPRDKFELLQAVWEMDQLFGIVKDPPSLINLETGKLLNEKQAKLIALIRNVETTTPAGKPTRVKAFGYWKDEFAQHRIYKSTDYVFGAERDLPGGAYNTFKPTGCASRKGHIVPWLRLTKTLFPDRQTLKFAVYWVAHLLQNPTVKLPTALVIHGSQGCGKSTWAYILLRLIFGPTNVIKVGAKELSGDFNSHFVNCILAIGEEISGLDPRHDYDALKDLISGETILVNEKFIPAYTRKSTMHLIFLSNNKVPVFLTDGDRRYSISHASEGLSRKEVSAIRKWAEDGGCEAVKYYLEHLDLARFDPYADAPLSKAKTAVIVQGRSALLDWAHNLMVDENRPDYVPFSILKHNADTELGITHSIKAVGNALADAGATRLGQVSYPNPKSKKIMVYGLKGQTEAPPEDELRKAMEGQSQARMDFFGHGEKY